MNKEQKIKYPLGIQSFPKIRNGEYFYVDKTEILYNLIQNEFAYFLSRPRRFGKSLLVSTLESLFLGKRELFSGLWIDSTDYKWTVHPVIRLDFGELISDTLESLDQTLHVLLDKIAINYNLKNIDSPFPAVKFSNIIIELSKINPVVILIDEYDRPFVNHLSSPDIVKRNREFLRDFFVRIKIHGEHLRLALITGVSKFSQVSIFSDLNNLVDISMSQEYASLLGITEKEIHTFLMDEVNRVARLRNERSEDLLITMKEWYNGYKFSRKEDVDKVYNPLSLMKFLDEGELNNFWFSTATPSFAIDLIKKSEQPIQAFENGIIAGNEIEFTFDAEKIDFPTLLFQTGYLTIDSYDENLEIYRLNFPNEEVKRSFLKHLLNAFANVSPSEMQGLIMKLSNYLTNHNFDGFFQLLNEFFSSIPYHIHEKKEAYYHSLIYLLLKSLGFDVLAEVLTNRGRIDMILKTSKSIFIFEFKMDGSSEQAIQQILDKMYYEQFLSDERDLILIGVNFDSKIRSLKDWVVRKIEK